jgi:leucyl aminopeptidase (aminopeptidase T)
MSRPPSTAVRLRELDFDLANAARHVIEGALGVVAGESVVVVVDREREALGETLVEIARASGAKAELIVLETMGARPLRSVPDKLRAALERAQASVLLIGFEEGEYSMRVEIAQLVAQLRLRHAHMVGVTRRAMLAGFSVEPSRILDATRTVRARLRPDSTLRLRSPAGSDLEVKLDPMHRWQERVGIIRPGKLENIPSGELFTSPGDTNGVFVADGSMGGHFGAAAGVLTRSPVKVEIEKGVCRAVHCVDRALERQVDRFLHCEFNGDRVGIIILGTNVGMHEPTGELICDQNMPGLHVGFGAPFPDQTGAKWNALTQLSMTSAGDDVDLDGAPLLRNGRYLIL